MSIKILANMNNEDGADRLQYPEIKNYENVATSFFKTFKF